MYTILFEVPVPTYMAPLFRETNNKVYAHVSSMLNEYYFHPDHLGVRAMLPIKMAW